MSAPLPPMSAVRVFEAAARLSSFTRAAAELGMTQAAVSYQMKVLEDRIGTPLFTRQPRGVALTAAGRRLAPRVSEAFDLLRGAFAEAREERDGVLTVTALHTLTSNWLVRRLGSFHLSHPGIAVRLDTSNRMVDFAREEFDIGIRSGLEPWPGLERHLLFRIAYTPVCSPSLLEGAPLARPADLLRLPLISPRDAWWGRWFEAAGLPGVDLSDRSEIEFGMQQLEGAAAVAGQGVALVSPVFFADDLAAGRLVQPFPVVMREERGYWVVYPKAKASSRKVAAFRDWILGEAARERV